MTLSDEFAGLEDHVGPDGVWSPPARETKGVDAKVVKFPCQGCNGSGSWRGRGKCFACDGKGYFLTSERDRAKARLQRATSKAKRLAEAQAAFDAQYPDVRPTLVAASKWSSFAAEFLGKIGQYGSLSEPQVRAVRSMAEKCAAKRASRAVEQEANKQSVDLTPIRAMFESARSNGYKAPVYRAAGLIISRAPDTGRNPGALYVKSQDDEYLGKIIGTDYTGKPAPALVAIAADPRGEAIRHGQRTGACSCCGRTLTVTASIEAGIGPVCAEKWGLH